MLKKRRNYIIILAIIATIFVIGILFNIKSVKNLYISVLAHMTSVDLLIAAGLVGFVFIGNKHYWLIVLGSSIIASIFIQLVFVSNGFVVSIIIARAIAFIAVIYCMNFVKLFVGGK